jgi:catechol 2,3-dioxygenase-like lactoylglutathione lyase family enzyme
MITGMHAIVFTREVEAARALLRDVLGLASVDAGGGWLIFRLPPAEIAAHPAEEPGPHELYLMCEDIHATVAELEGKGVKVLRPVSDEGWGLLTAIEIPGGGELGLYEPRHPLPPPGPLLASGR